jgi:TetR/AcrR family transcriptional regulator, mexJK operon transcriptional repressor
MPIDLQILEKAEASTADAIAPLRGRPTDEAKYAAIIAAARIRFFETGFTGTAIEVIARDAGVSKVTIYNRFTDKAGLFSAVIQAECSGMQDLLCPSMGNGEDFRDRLINFGVGMIEFLAREDITRFETMMAMEMERDPAIGELFLAAGPRRMRAGMMHLIAEGAQQEGYAIDDPSLAADLLGGMMKGFADMERRFSSNPPPGHAIIHDRVAYAVDIFLKGHSRTD